VSRTQRLTFLGIAVVIAIVAVIVLSSSGGSDQQAATQPQTTATPSATAPASPEATPAQTATPTPTPPPEPPLVTPGKVAKLRFTEGDTVRFRVRADTADEVHVHGYDLKKNVEPGKTVTFSFPATITGIFEIELEHAAQQIAQLRVDPA
jgi:heme/copper-type cytochrome/quinol oxidase subunit 2